MPIFFSPLDFIYTLTHWNKPEPTPVTITNPYISAFIAILVITLFIVIIVLIITKKLPTSPSNNNYYNRRRGGLTFAL
jgi:hypothetical protein